MEDSTATLNEWLGLITTGDEKYLVSGDYF
jgi:hypothetical protein